MNLRDLKFLIHIRISCEDVLSEKMRDLFFLSKTQDPLISWKRFMMNTC